MLLQRDHGGRLQGSTDSHASFRKDAECGFDLIHIDPWKRFIDLDEVVHETVENILFCHSINPQCYYEIGTEEAIHKYTDVELDYFLSSVKKELNQSIWEKVKYAVIQSGTRISGTENIGVFDEERCKRMIEVCYKYNLLSKEHNGDYLTPEAIKKRFDLGLSAINIAPEFGVLETKTIMKRLNNKQDLFEKLFNICYNSKKWVKWLPENFSISNEDDKKRIVEVSCHYVFATLEFEQIKHELFDIDKEILQNHKQHLEQLNN